MRKKTALEKKTNTGRNHKGNMLHHRDIACGGTFVPLPQMAARRDNSSDLGSARAASQMLKKAKGEL